MTFAKREDGYWHWEYRGARRKGSCRTLLLAWIISLLFAAAAVLLSDPGPEHKALYWLVAAGLMLGISALFGVFWLLGRAQKTFRYTANAHRLSPFGALKQGHKMSLRFAEVKRLQPLRSENTIRVWAGPVPFDLYASDEDFDAVWRFVTERCPGARIR